MAKEGNFRLRPKAENSKSHFCGILQPHTTLHAYGIFSPPRYKASDLVITTTLLTIYTVPE